MVIRINRREFMCVTLSTGLVVLIRTSSHSGFTRAQQRTFLAAARTIFPHDHVSDHVYVRAIARIDDRCWRNPNLSTLLTASLSALERTCPDFGKASQGARIIALKTLEGSEFFQILYSELLEALYGPPEMWSLFVQRMAG